ncbi:antitoxin [Streptomyces sp. NPDC059786]|uniref:antitoxin n=1 Tax=Streptomyces sp. NPDC059786 TaxID=3346946 RepID=UPI00366A2E2D
MGIFDKLKNLGQSKGSGASDAAERAINEKTGNKYSKQVDQAQQQAEDRLGVRRDRHEEQ